MTLLILWKTIFSQLNIMVPYVDIIYAKSMCCGINDM